METIITLVTSESVDYIPLNINQIKNKEMTIMEIRN